MSTAHRHPQRRSRARGAPRRRARRAGPAPPARASWPPSRSPRSSSPPAIAPWADNAVQEVTLPLRHDDIIRQQAARQGPRPGADRRRHLRRVALPRPDVARRRQGPDAADARARPTTSPASPAAPRSCRATSPRRRSTSPTAPGTCATCCRSTTAARCSRSPPTTPARARSTSGSRTRAARGERFRAADHIPFPETRGYVEKVLDARSGATAGRTRASSGSERSPLAGRGALVTGVSRRVGIGYAIARRLRELGADVFVQGCAPHDAGQPWGADPAGVPALPPSSGAAGQLECDFADPAAPAPARGRGGRARRTSTSWSPTTRCPATRPRGARGRGDRRDARGQRARDAAARAGLRRAPRRRAPRRPRVLFTSGQHLEPMARELPYAAEQGRAARHHGVAGGPPGAARHPRQRAQPGPDRHRLGDAGAARGTSCARLPLGRWGSPEDAARLVGWLATDDAGWITGQVLTSDGGFSLSRG